MHMPDEQKNMEILVGALKVRYGEAIYRVYSLAQENCSTIGAEESSSMFFLRTAYEALDKGDKSLACQSLGVIDQICSVKPAYLTFAQKSSSDFIQGAAKQIDLGKNQAFQTSVRALIKELSGQKQ